MDASTIGFEWGKIGTVNANCFFKGLNSVYSVTAEQMKKQRYCHIAPL